jgi:formate/nitrite transporter FocA (FNT family)
MLRAAWAPAYIGGAILAVGLLALRLVADLESPLAVIAAVVVGTLAYWLGLFLVIADPMERRLLVDVLGLRRGDVDASGSP